MGRTRGREQPLTAKARAFADAYAGKGTGVSAARAAGYTGRPAVLQVTAAKLIAEARVRERIVARVGAETFASWMATAPELPPAVNLDAGPKLPTDPLIKGKGRGTPTERIELLMAASRKLLKSKEPDAVKVGIAAVLAAAELEGERGRTRRSGFDRPLLSPNTAPAPAPKGDAPPDPPPTPPRAIRLVMSSEDRRHG
jgi:hypothetical protein